MFPSEGGDRDIKRVIGQGREDPGRTNFGGERKSGGCPYGIGSSVVQELTRARVIVQRVWQQAMVDPGT